MVVTYLIDLPVSFSRVDLSAQPQAALRAVLPPMAAVNNPVDIIGDAPAARYAAALNIICAEKDLDGIILILTPQMMTAAAAVAELIVEFRKQKPILPVFVGGPAIEDGLVCLKKNNLANFTFPKDAVEALNHLARGAKKPEKITGADHPPVSTPALTMMEFAAISKILGDYGIELAGVLAKQKADLAEIIPKLGAGPFALKIISSDIIHKTDSGAVKLNLKNIAETERAWDEIIAKNPGIKLAGGLVQPMISGKEMIIGLKRDPTFGPTILFGWGGIFAEILKDTVLRLAPVSPAAARLMIQEIKGVKILTGHRGEKSVDLEALAEVIVKISNLAVDHPEIQEMDLNPVMATPEGAMVIDVRIMV